MLLVLAGNFPDFGYDVGSVFDTLEIASGEAVHNPSGSPVGFKGIIAACKLVQRDKRYRGRVGISFWSGAMTRHSDLLWKRGMKETEQPELTLPYGGRAWDVCGRFSWEEKQSMLKIGLWIDAGPTVNVAELPAQRGLSLVMGLACGRSVMELVGADPRRTEIELSTVPNFKTRPGHVMYEPIRMPAIMPQILDAIEHR